MKIHVLVENTTNSNLICEHGLSLFIEFEGQRYLLDAGQSGAFMKNAKEMGVAIEEANYAILSHGHYDHAGGFGIYLDTYSHVRLYGMKGITKEYYSGSGGSIHEIGVPKEVLLQHKNKFILVEEVTKIAPHVYLIPHSTAGLELIGEKAKLYQKQEERYVPDDFSHEMSLVFETEKGIVIFNSCSHGGFSNIIEEVKAVFSGEKIYAFCGGLHMKGTKNGEEYCTFTKEELQELVDCFRKEKMEKLYTGHCTGTVGTALLKDLMGAHLEVLTTGITFEI